jgi:hypothetical protein
VITAHAIPNDRGVAARGLRPGIDDLRCIKGVLIPGPQFLQTNIVIEDGIVFNLNGPAGAVKQPH